MAKDLVFITGATGFIGFAVLTKALQAGHRVRVSVRRAAQIETLSSHAIIAPFVEKGAVEFVVVPDIGVEGAFDEVLKDVKGVLHLASPLPAQTEDPENDIILPAIRGTTTILNSALKHPSIRRVVITSSVVALMDFQAFIVGDTKTIYTTATRRNPLPTAPWGTYVEAYMSSKALSLDATEKFLAEKNPHFTIVNLMPGFVIGRSEIATKTEDLIKSTNSVPLTLVLGAQKPNLPPIITHIDDVSRIHVLALEEERVQGNKNFLLESSGPTVVFEEILDVAKTEFADAVEEGILPLGGKGGEAPQTLDSKETTEVFGELKTYREAVRSVLGQYVEFKRKELALEKEKQ